MGKRILIIDDEPSIRESLSGILEDEGFDTVTASSAEIGLDLIEEEDINLILLDIWLGDNMDGITALEKIKERSAAPVIMISGHGTIETAAQAIRKGAFDFVEKPLSYDKIILAITNGLRFAHLKEENLLLREKSPRNAELVGNSPAMTALKQQIEMVAPTDSWVLIRGEHGTDKEMVAHTIHQKSHSSNQPMVEVNCAAKPEELIESELFGHEKGSFTGAHSRKQGKFDQADGGILFLNEIGCLSLKIQAKILRILQEQKFERVGGHKTIKVKVRVLAATSKNLEEEIENGNFRADLFWRLNVVSINVPSLRDRIEDIPLLVEDISRHQIGNGLSRKTFSAEAFDAMKQYSWPGNVRELKNFIERLALMRPEKLLTGDLVSLFLPPLSPAAKSAETAIYPYLNADFKDAKRMFEKEYLQQKLLANDNNISKTAEEIGLERSHLHKKLKSLDIIL